MDAAEDDQITPLPNLGRRRSQRRTRPQSAVSFRTEGEMNDLTDFMSSSYAVGAPVIDSPNPYSSHFGGDLFDDPTLFTTRKSRSLPHTTPNSPVTSAANSSSESLNRFSDPSPEFQLQVPTTIRSRRSRVSTDSMPGLTASINSASTGRFTCPGPTTPIISPVDLPSPDSLAMIDERHLSDEHADDEEEHGHGHGHGSLDHHDHEDHQREEDDHEHDDDHLDNDPFPPLREKELRAPPTMTGTGSGTRRHTAWPQKKSDIHWLHVDRLSPPLSSGGGRRHHVSMDGAAVSQVSLVSTKTTATTRPSPSFARFFKKSGEDKLVSEEEREEKKRAKKEEARATRERMRVEKAQRELEMPMTTAMMGGRAF